jgi:hypothetical protein
MNYMDFINVKNAVATQDDVEFPLLAVSGLWPGGTLSGWK